MFEFAVLIAFLPFGTIITSYHSARSSRSYHSSRSSRSYHSARSSRSFHASWPSYSLHAFRPFKLKTCPEGYVDLAVSCYLSASTWHFKKSEGRTAGKIPVKCDLDQDSVEDTQSERELVFCYEKCQPGYSGWGARCFLEDVDAAKAGATASESAASMSVV